MKHDFMNGDALFSIAVRDPVWKHIWLTPALRDITLSEPFLRLYRIKQLGPTEYVYPGATHTRASHSLGVYHLAHKMLRVLLQRGADRWVTDIGCNSFLVAALLHDLGHFPFTHSLKELPLEDHEILTSRMLDNEPLKSLIVAAGADPVMTGAIIDKHKDISGADATETVFFRNLLSGVLDPDKLDYLNRDAYYCGVPYGIQDTDFILSRIQPDRNLGIVLDSKAIMSIESILFSKYLMYKSVYWHKQVRIATAMMKKTLYTALEMKIIRPESLYSLDDSSIYSLIESLDFPEKELASSVRNRSFYPVIAEYHFSPDDANMKVLENLEKRSEAERILAEYLTLVTGTAISKTHILIDIPEQISFESDLFIVDENRIFSESSTVFSGNVVNAFTASLRMLRIAIHRSHYQAMEAVSSLNEKLAKCLKLSYTSSQ
jgi:HD superfamily phosphohydrolase